MTAYRAAVFTLDSLSRCLIQDLDTAWFRNFAVPDDGSWGVLRRVVGGTCFVLDERSKEPRARIVIQLGASGFFDALETAGLTTALQRIHRFGVQAARRHLSFPHNWSPYTAGNLTTIFAYQLTIGSERMIAETISAGAPDVYMCAVTSQRDQVDITGYAPDHGPYLRATSDYGIAAEQVTREFETLTRPRFEGVIDLEAVGAGAVAAGRTFSTWLPLLSEPQKTFLQTSADRSLKLRGPAGSGKTLAMELKVLRECYQAQEQQRAIRVLYVTHSWAMAQQVQETLELLDERDVLGNVDVFPLLTLAEASGDRLGIAGIRILGDDSHEGKQLQLATLATILDEARRGPWLTFKASVSDLLRQRVEAEPGTLEANRLLWALMLELSCVIGAAGILPGLNANTRYLQIDRRPWMMPLPEQADRLFVFHIYDRLVRQLSERREMTTDQLINDYLASLSTYRWHAQRLERGYDMVFVDELHLFNEQERMVFPQLTRDPDAYPVVLMALDPRQSPAESYAEFSVADVRVRESGAADRALGDYENIDLRTVFRYTPQIHHLLRHMDGYYPTLELGADWSVTAGEAGNTREHGEVPTLVLHSSAQSEVRTAIEDALAIADTGRRVALLCLDNAAFEDYAQAIRSHSKNVRFHVVDSRDDVEKLRYSTSRVVVSQPHYVAGLQFDAVIIGGCRPTFSQYDPHQAYGLRRFLADLYLGASRARDVLHIHASGERGQFPTVLETALEADILANPT